MNPRLGTTPKVVSMGGGHGLAASLSALRRLPVELTGVVTVADNGGSSGRLRDELGILPPGDLRMALAALCGDDDWGRTWADVLQHRFHSGGDLHGHAVGNLLLAAVWERLGDNVAGLDLVGELLGAQGRVLPMASVPLSVTGSVRLDASPDLVTEVHGQVEVAESHGRVVGVRLDPLDPPACPEAVAAVDEADWVVVGPGSWFTSVIPNLLVPQLREALVGTRARRVLVMNLQAQEGETDGFDVEDHLHVIAEHAPDLRFDVVLVDDAAAPRVVDARGSLATTAKSLGARVVTAPVAVGPGSDQHDPLRLAAAYQRIFDDA